VLQGKDPELILYSQSNQTAWKERSLKRFGVLKQTLIFAELIGKIHTLIQRSRISSNRSNYYF